MQEQEAPNTLMLTGQITFKEEILFHTSVILHYHLHSHVCRPTQL